MAKRNGHVRRARAVNLCRHFSGTDLAGFAKAGLEALEADHKPIIGSHGDIGCGVALDQCRKHAETDSDRWDYVFTLREGNNAFGIEVHHATADQAAKMIAKKAWAEALLRDRCPSLNIQLPWIWIAAPPEGDIMFDRLHPVTRQPAEAGISFPVRKVVLP